MSAPSAPTSNRSPTRGTRAIANTSWSISPSSPSAASSAAAMAPPPSIAGPSTGQSWLAQHLALPNGIPSRDCIRRLAHGAQARGLPTLLPGLDRRRDPDRRRRRPDVSSPSTARPVAARTTRAKGLGALHIVSAWASEEGIALGQVATDAKIQRDHRHPAAPGADRPGRHPDHDRRDGLPEGDRRADRRRWRRLRDRRQGQPAEAPGGDPDALLRSPGERPEGPPVPVPRDARRRARPHRRTVVLSREGAA